MFKEAPIVGIKLKQLDFNDFCKIANLMEEKKASYTRRFSFNP